MIFELAGDFHDAVAAIPREHPKHRMLELLEEAVRRDVHFIARHPTTLFQCMWNTCWWYDCHEAEKYVDSHSLKAFPQGAPWTRQSAKLSDAMTLWLAGKSAKQPGFKWLRSLVPPALGIGTGERFILQGHAEDIAKIAFNSDGSSLVSIGSKSIRTWDTSTGAEVSSHPLAFTTIRRLGLSMDGKLAVVAEQDRIHVVDVRSGLLQQTIMGESWEVGAVSISSDGSKVGAVALRHVHGHDAGRCSTIYIWDVASGRRIWAVEKPLREDESFDCGSIAFTPDSNHLVTGCVDGTIAVWDLRSDGMSEWTTTGFSCLSEICVSPDGGTFASCSPKGVQIWDTHSGEMLKAFAEEAGARAGSYSRDGTKLITGSARGSVIQLWDIASSSQIKLLYGNFPGLDICGVAFSPQTNLLAACSGQCVFIWETESPAQDAIYLGGISSGSEVWYYPDGNTLVHETFADRGMREAPTILRLRSVGSPQQFQDIECDIDGPACVAFSKDGRLMAVGGTGGLGIWDLSADLGCNWCVEREWTVTSLCYSPDARLLAVCSIYPHVLALIVTETGLLATPQLSMDGCGITPEEYGLPVFSRDGHLISCDVSGFRKGELENELSHVSYVWQVATGTLLESHLLKQTQPMSRTLTSGTEFLPQVGKPLSASWHPSAARLFAHPMKLLWAGGINGGLTMLTLAEGESLNQ